MTIAELERAMTRAIDLGAIGVAEVYARQIEERRGRESGEGLIAAKSLRA